jgi:hypothetical protein
MEGNRVDLEHLVRKYQEQVDSLQRQLDEAKGNLSVVSQALALLEKEGNGKQMALSVAPIMLSTKYKDLSMSDAIKDILRAKHPEKLSADAIYTALIENGFKSNSQNMKRDLYTRLYRMADQGSLNAIKRGKVKKYSLVIEPGMGIRDAEPQTGQQA